MNDPRDDSLTRLSAAMAAMVAFPHIRDGAVLSALRRFLDCDGSPLVRVEKYSAFVAALYEQGCRLDTYLCQVLYEDDNRYVRLRAAGEPVPPVLAQAVTHELALLARLTTLQLETLWARTGYDGFLPGFENQAQDISALYEERMAHVSRYGYGVFVGHSMFRLLDGVIQPVRSPDPVRLSDLVGYEAQHEKVLDNTRALLEGRPAADLLLVGDAGTGKSSTVKAVVNELAPAGVRLLELRKEQILELPDVLEQLCGNPLKFVLFIDDLTFQPDDNRLGTLKAILEGSAYAKSANTVLYVTSNRRHLVRETFSDREGDDVHRNDTMQELLSLSARFGQTIQFSKPDQTLYLSIVETLAQRQGVTLPTEQLRREAEAFALRKGGRSPRAAEQFIDGLLAMQVEN